MVLPSCEEVAATRWTEVEELDVETGSWYEELIEGVLWRPPRDGLTERRSDQRTIGRVVPRRPHLARTARSSITDRAAGVCTAALFTNAP